MTRRQRSAEIRQGDPCPHCGGHAFEVLRDGRRGGVVVLKCLECSGKVLEIGVLKVVG